MSEVYQGKRNSMKVFSNTSGNMTFKIPADSTDKKTSLVTLSDYQLEDLSDKIDAHLDGVIVNHSAARAAIEDQIVALVNARGDHSAAISHLQDALSHLS